MVVLFVFFVSVSFVGYDVLAGQGVVTVSAATTTAKSNEVSCKKTRYVTATSLNVRKSASAKAKKITTIKYRTKVTVIATIKDSSWVKVSINGGKTVGYVNCKYLSSKKPAKKSSGDSANNGSSSNNSGDGSSNNGGIGSPDDSDDKPLPPEDMSVPGGW
jgi:uncharacterized protein YgiM (DUF1202 family)